MIACIVNQDAGKAPTKMKLLSKLARTNNLRIKFCDGPDLDYTIRQTLENIKLKRLIIGGGDGSVSLAASLIRRMNPKVELAVLPVGTANYYAKSLGVGRNMHRAFEIALANKTEKRHLCRVNKRDFLLGVNIGATSSMLAEVTSDNKRRFGKIAYVRGLFQVLRRFDAPDVTVVVNGMKKEYVSTELVVLNQYLPERIQLTPKVSGSEPYFEIITYGLGNSKLSPLFGAAIFVITLGRNQKYLKRIKATSATIRTKKPLPVAIDGDSLEQTPIEVSMQKIPVVFVCA